MPETLEDQVCKTFDAYLEGKELCCLRTAHKSLRYVSLLREAQRLDAVEAEAREELALFEEFLEQPK